MEIKDIIRKSALELSIDSEKSDDVKQKNIETRTAVIGFIDMFIDRELYVTEQVIANTYLEEFPDNEDEEDTEEPSFEENIEI